MYYPRYRSYRRQQSNFRGYLTPFVMIIAIGFILVLLYGLWNMFFGEKDVHAAYLHIVEGSVDMRTWGSEDFINLSTDALVLQGDEIVTTADSKVIVEFFDGTIMRMNGGTDVTFETFDGEGEVPMISMLLVDGELWVNKLYKGTTDTNFSVKLANATVVSSQGNIFEVESGIDQTVRVIHGKNVNVDILDEEGKKAVANEALGVGQEIVLGEAAFERYWKFQSPEVIAAISDKFKAEDWAVWNTAEDQNPTKFEKSVNGNQFVKVAPEVIEEVVGAGEEDENVAAEDEVVAEGEIESSETAETSKIASPVLVSVNGVSAPDETGVFVVKDHLAVIKGTVAEATKVFVNDYALQKYNAGDSNWSYFANADYDLMKEGENIFNVYAVDAEGNKSVALVVKVLYKSEKPVEMAAPEAEVETATVQP